MIEWLVDHWKDLGLICGGIVTAASVIVRLTPTPKDDAILAKVIAILNVLALNPKQDKPSEEPGK